MAKLHGPLPITGKLNGLIYYKSGDEFKVRMAPRVNKERYKNSPEFARFHRQMKDFGTIAKGNKMLRLAFRQQHKILPQKEILSRLGRVLGEVLSTDPVNIRGSLSFNNADFSLLIGFEFNDKCQLQTKFHAPFDCGINQREGRSWIRIPAFKVRENVNKAGTASHFRLVSASTEIDFDNEQYNTIHNSSRLISLDETECEEILLPHMHTPDPEGALFVVLGIQYYSDLDQTPFCGGAALKLVGACNE